MTASISEADWMKQVVQLAETLGWKVLHVRRSLGRRNGKRAWQTTTSITGWPDLLMFRPGRIVAAELKSETGRPTADQVEVLAGLAAAGVETFVWRPSDLDRVAAVLSRKEIAS